MKKLIFTLLFIITTGLVFSDILGEPLVSVNLIKPELITAQEVDTRIEQYNKQLLSSGIPQKNITRKEMLESMIASVLIAQAAEKSGIKVQDQDVLRVVQAQKKSAETQLRQNITDEQFKQLIIRQTASSWDNYLQSLREQLLQQSYITQNKKALFQNIKVPTPGEIELKYKENAQLFLNPEYIRVSMIFIPTLNKEAATVSNAKEKLETAYSELKNGKISFDDAVLKYSEEESIKYRGGDIGYVARDNRSLKLQLGEDFFNNMFELGKNEISDVMESRSGLHILKITDKREARLLSLDDTVTPDNPILVKDYIKEGILQERQQLVLQKALEEINAELREEAEIIYF